MRYVMIPNTDSILRWMGVLAALLIISASAFADSTTTTASSTTSTTEKIDYNKVTCFSDTECTPPMRGPPYCTGNTAVRDVTYGACENPGTEESKCVQQTNTTVIAECGNSLRCQNGRCASQGAQSPPETVAEAATLSIETTTTQPAEADLTPLPPTIPTTLAPPAASEAQPGNTTPTLIWALLFAILALLILAAIATSTLILYLLYKRMIKAPQYKGSAIYSSGKKSTLR
jgi:hypothetical protein